jgi:hypothetical protein
LFDYDKSEPPARIQGEREDLIARITPDCSELAPPEAHLASMGGELNAPGIWLVDSNGAREQTGIQ